MPFNEKKWRGDELAERGKRALGRAIVKIGDEVATDATAYAHVISGTLRRSIHTAPMDYVGAADLTMARVSSIPNVLTPSWDGEDPVIRVGSWLPYACVEEVGRGHQFISPAVQGMMGPRSDAIMREAAAAEGLI